MQLFIIEIVKIKKECEEDKSYSEILEICFLYIFLFKPPGLSLESFSQHVRIKLIISRSSQTNFVFFYVYVTADLQTLAGSFFVGLCVHVLTASDYPKMQTEREQ